MIYYYLNNDKLKAMFATASGKRVAVKEFFDMDFPSEFLNDPSATNIDLQLTEAMLDMIRKNEIKAKSAKFVLENSKIPFREMILPYAKPSILYPIISSELFTDKKLADNHTVDYVEIDRNIDDPEEVAAALNAPAEGEEDVSDGEEKKKKAKKARLMVTYIDNLVIENLRKCCREVGMKLTAVDISQNALSKLVSFMKDDLPQYFVLVDYRITTITSYLFADYKHVFSLTKPIYSMPNENYANEMAFFINDFSSIVSEAIQFFRSKYTDYKFDDVFITGDLDRFQSVENDLYGFMGLNVKMLPVPDSVTGMEQLEFNSFAPLIGTMLK
ncbi:MAG: hypothetical protein SOV23_03610 [Eubacteriales bacterium]|nr:hypothetical protein [Christensenellaceae bacterium]MDY2751329.1 hypothetical protein [Eubacteriales bacterium]